MDTGETSNETPNDQQEPEPQDLRARKSILAALAAKSRAPTLPCTVCGASDWSVGHFSPIPVSYTATKMSILAGKIYPMVTIVCRNCGNTHFVNLNILGFDEDAKAELNMESEDTSSDAE